MDHPIIIVGNPRSGTTLLRLILTCHPRICIPPEGPFLFLLEPKYGQIREFEDTDIIHFVDDIFSVTKMEEWNLDRDRLIHHMKGRKKRSFASLVEEVYREYMRATGQIKARWGDKSGSYTIHRLDAIQRSLPGAFLLHIVRDGRDVACSYRSLKGMEGKYAPNLPDNIFDIASTWVSNINTIDSFMDRWPSSQQAEVRYEDLVRSPKATLQRLCAALGERYDPGMLQFHIQNKKHSLEPEVFLDWKEKTRTEVSASQVGRWRKELSQDDVFKFEVLAKDELMRHNYELNTRNNGDHLNAKLIMKVKLMYLKNRGYHKAKRAKGKIAAKLRRVKHLLG